MKFGMASYLASVGALLVGTSASASLLVAEDFDGTSTWTNDVASKLFVDPSSSNEGLFIQAGGDLGPDNVLFGRDLTNEAPEPVLNPVTLTFNTVDISGQTDVEVSFEYHLNGFDAGDEITYLLTFTGGSDSGTLDGSDEGTYEFLVPDAATEVSLQLTLDQNGGSDTFELDNFEINIIPEPASLGLIGLGALAMLGRKRRTH